MECPEFWQLLLLLCADLKDSDIPHQTKIWAQVIKAWKVYFNSLKQKLFICACCPVVNDRLMSGIGVSWQNQLHIWSLVQQEPAVVSLSDCSLDCMQQTYGCPGTWMCPYCVSQCHWPPWWCESCSGSACTFRSGQCNCHGELNACTSYVISFMGVPS